MTSLNDGITPSTSNINHQDGENCGNGSGENGRGQSMLEELHPLKIPIILTLLFQLCPPATLAASRLVCKQWREISLSSWRKSSPLSFHRNNTTQQITLGKANTPLNVFWEYFYNPQNKCQDIPFRCVKFGSLRFERDDEEIKIFWRVFQDDLTYLELEECIFPEVDEFRHIIYNCFPNLQRLCLRFCKYLTTAPSSDFVENPDYIEPVHGHHPNLRLLEVYEDQKLPISTLELLSHFQSLEGITYCASTPNNSYRLGNVKSLLIAILVIRRHDMTKLDLKRFNIIKPIMISSELHTHTKFRLIRQLNLPLERLDIHSDQVEEGANQVLENHSRTLRDITVESKLQAGPSYWNLPGDFVLENLESLEMRGGVICENMKFLGRLPNLRKLVLRSHDQRHQAPTNQELPFVANTDQLHISTLRLPRLMEFEIDYDMSVENLRCLVKVMPNIEILFMTLNDQLFGVVCQNWRKLRRLGLFGNSLTDRGVAGVSYTSSEEDVQSQIRDQAEDDGEPPSISLLKGLERFYGRVPHLTDASMFNGFLKLPKLQDLFLDVNAGQFGADARAALEHRRRVNGLNYRLNGGGVTRRE